MAPLKNRNGDLAVGVAHRWIDLEGDLAAPNTPHKNNLILITGSKLPSLHPPTPPNKNTQR